MVLSVLKCPSRHFTLGSLVYKYSVTDIQLEVSENKYQEASIRSDVSGLTRIRYQIVGENTR